MNYKNFSISLQVLRFAQMERQVERQNVTNVQFTTNTHTNVHNVTLPVTKQFFVKLLRVYHLIGNFKTCSENQIKCNPDQIKLLVGITSVF
jgi:hypothetical protein